jgi:3-hydroxy acid dehydrogenase / malonic semialdehyde reductase
MSAVRDRIVLITGASSGIGEACAYMFAEAGARLILTARRQTRLEVLKTRLIQQFGVEVQLLNFDVRDHTALEQSLTSLPSDWQAIDILINNAGLSRGLDKLQEGSITDWEEMIDTNVKGLLYMTRAIVPGMVARGCGHVINIGSLAGHETYPMGNVYCGTKAAVRAISLGLKQDLLGTSVRVSCIDPGLVETEFSQVRFHGDEDRAKAVYQNLTPLTAQDIADVILFCATRPAHVNINEIFMMPTAQSGATLVHRGPMSTE